MQNLRFDRYNKVMNTQPQEGATGNVRIRLADSTVSGDAGQNPQPQQASSGSAADSNSSPLPSSNLSDTNQESVRQSADSVGHGRTETSDSVGQEPKVSDTSVGHDPDLPARDAQHTLTTYEAAKMFEEANCRVSERTIIRWCNKNKRGQRRLVCAFEPVERKYYIDENSVRSVIREEIEKGRQSEQFTPDLSDIAEDASDTGPTPEPKTVRHESENVGHGRTETSDSVGQEPKVSDTSVGHEEEMSDAIARGEQQMSSEGTATLLKKTDEEYLALQIELTKLQEQAKTKDEMMTFLRKEIDRRGERIEQDRETYEKSLEWFRTQIEAKDQAIERLNTEMRGLLEAPRQQQTHSEPGHVSHREPDQEPSADQT